MQTIEQDPFQAVAARTNAGKALQAWCRETESYITTVVYVLGGACFAGFLFCVIAYFRTPY